nr:MAK10-like protein [Tanacetum cinerariifolium]GEZ74021.1 MAK10-like protein [Tanacetum cinerariifolium]
MRDVNPICTLRDYSKPRHEGYRNNIELPVRNNVVPLQYDTIWLVQNRCSFHRLRFQDPIYHLKDFLRTVDSVDLNGDTRNTTHLCLFHFSLHDQAIIWLDRLPAGSILTWDDLTTRGRLMKLRPEVALETIKDLAQYKEEGWNDPIIPKEGSLDYENPDLDQLLGVMECKVGTLMVKAILLMGRRESIFGMLKNMMHQLPPERELSNLKNTCKLKEEIIMEENRTKKIKKITREVLSFDEPKYIEDLGLNPLPNCPSLDVSLGEERGSKSPIKPHSSDSFRMKEVYSLTIHTPPSPHVVSFHPKDMY